MNNPVGRVDIHARDTSRKIGEMSVNEDGTLDGFLFEYYAKAVVACINTDPEMISFSVFGKFEPIPPKNKNVRFVWYSPSGEFQSIGNIDMNRDGSFSGQVEDPRVKKMVEDDMLLDMGFSARASIPAEKPEESYTVAHAEKEYRLREKIRGIFFSYGMTGSDPHNCLDDILKEGIQFYELSAAKPAEESNLVSHARRELEIMGEESDVIEGYLKVIQAFADMGHSGGSTMIAVPIVHILLNQGALGPLTDYPDDWHYHNEKTWGAQGGIWQSKRDSKAFSSDGGKTYCRILEGRGWSDPITCDLDDRTKKETPDGGSVHHVPD